MDRSLTRAWGLGLLLAVLASCGGSGGGGTPVASGGIGGTGVARGPINAFGSIFVNGTRWDIDRAAVRLDGIDVARDRLRLGMVVTVRGQFAADGASGVASSVSFNDSVEGPVAAVNGIDPEGGSRKRVIIFGQQVILERHVTVFEDNSGAGVPGFGFDAIDIGDLVEVSGPIDAGNTVRATRVEKKGTISIGASRVELQGEASEVVPGAGFKIGSITIAVDAGTIFSNLPGGVVDGARVEVYGVLEAADRVRARRIESDGAETLPPELERVSLEGYVRDFQTSANFHVARVRVDASLASLIPNEPSLFANGAKVEVFGPLSGGVLQAEKLRFKDENVEIEARLSAVDARQGALTVLGIEVRVDATTRFEDDRDGDTNLGLAELRAGDFVRVRGFAVGPADVAATRLERRDVDDVTLKGRLGAFNPLTRRLQILGVEVETDLGTEFENLADEPISGDAFFDQVRVGDLVRVKDDRDADNGAIDVADEVELEDD